MAKRKRESIHRGGDDKYSLIPRGHDYKPYILIQDVITDVIITADF